MTQPHSPGARVGIVGASTLKGKELQAVLRERQFPVSKMILMDSDEDLGLLSEFDGEPVVSLAISESSFEFLDLVFFAGNPNSAVSYARLGGDRNFVAIDLTNALSKDRRFPLFLEIDKGKKPGITPVQGVICSPHPAAISIALVLQRLSSKHQIRHSVISIFEPASERGNMGVDELEKQTLNIFSFHKGPEIVFNRQLAFNLLSRLGEQAKERLIDGEEVIAHQLSVLLGGDCPLPALTLIQAPVFHSYSFSIFVEMDRKVSVDETESLLECENVTVIRSADEPPSPAQVAGMDTIQIGGIKPDFLNPNGLWFWAVSDNLRLAAINAVAAAEAVFLP